MQKTSPPILFDARRLKAVEARAKDIKHDDADFLYREAATTIAERLNATNRDFKLAIDLTGSFASVPEIFQNCGKVGELKQVGIQFDPQKPESPFLNIEPNSANLITSVFTLHRVNDLPGLMIQVKNALVEDGLFMACLPGDKTLRELRACLIEAESELAGSASLRVDPFVEVRQAGALLQRAGFALPVTDADVLTVRYASLDDLLRDIRSMAAGNVFAERVRFGPRGLKERAAELYAEKFTDPDGRIRATVEIIYLSGWKPHPSQQRPLKPGSAIKNLKDVLGE